MLSISLLINSRLLAVKIAGRGAVRNYTQISTVPNPDVVQDSTIVTKQRQAVRGSHLHLGCPATGSTRAGSGLALQTRKTLLEGGRTSRSRPWERRAGGSQSQARGEVGTARGKLVT